MKYITGLLLLCLASCGLVESEFKKKVLALEKECMEKLEEPVDRDIDFSVAKFCWCFVKESPPKTKEECMEEAQGE